MSGESHRLVRQRPDKVEAVAASVTARQNIQNEQNHFIDNAQRASKSTTTSSTNIIIIINRECDWSEWKCSISLIFFLLFYFRINVYKMFNFISIFVYQSVFKCVRCRLSVFGRRIILSHTLHNVSMVFSFDTCFVFTRNRTPLRSTCRSSLLCDARLTTHPHIPYQHKNWVLKLIYANGFHCILYFICWLCPV